MAKVGHYSRGTGDFGTAQGTTVEEIRQIQKALAALRRYPYQRGDIKWLQVQIEYRESRPTVAGSDICDFCLGRKPVYVHEVFPFSIPLRARGFADYEDDGQWVACDPCHWLLERRDIEGLLARGPQSREPDEQEIRRLMISVAVEHLTGWFWRG